MSFLRILLLTLSWLPARTDAALELRERVALAIVAVTDDPLEQNLLARIARWESGYRADVADCRVLGGAGERGAWQVIARTPAERSTLCLSLEGDARAALARIRESVTACAFLPASERLAVYTRGSCSSLEGRRMSRLRWASVTP